MKPATITCPKCAGTGRAELDEALEETMCQILVHGPSTASDLSPITPGISATGINQRLERLRAFGLLRRQREGKCWRYFPVTNKTK